jgi:protein farnesyltransferase subunit beta
VEGGFAGRTNKLVDGCYSFWQGGAFPVLGLLLGSLSAREQGKDGETREVGDSPNAPASSARLDSKRLSQNAADAGAPACALFPTSPSASFESDAGLGVAFNARALQGWLLLCCQLPNGGLQDKPGKGRDHYHTCYCLSGLSVAQHFGRDGVVGPPAANLLEKINPLVNVVESAYVRWMSAVEKRTRT